MTDEKKWALEKAVELTVAALSSPTGGHDKVVQVDNATRFLEGVYDKLVELQSK